MIAYSEHDGALSFKVYVVPRASRSELVGEYNDGLRVRLAAPPVDGAGNAELIHTLGRAFDVPRSAVEVVAGQRSKAKQVRLKAVSAEMLRRVIASLTVAEHKI